ncbi:TetR/AcrR family transcriptional regulator [Nakamurella sp.]|uniref:TetR/AcrR family transcriptional regulator n=1 Tax=Nakamurella sp. TaxID=1869182 RepID=UPI003B3BD5CF
MTTPPAPPAPGAAPASRQKRTGQAVRDRSRLRLVVAAGEVFAARGYTGATVQAIADRAGVSLQTLYAAWGSKRALLRAHLEFTMTGSATAVSEGRWAPTVGAELEAAAAPDPATRLRALASFFRSLAERVGPVWRLYREAAAVDPEIATDHAELERGRRRTLTAALAGLDDGCLRPGLTRSAAVDTLLVLAGPATYETLVEGRGYSLDEFEAWLAGTLIATLLRSPDAAGAG